MPTHANRRIQLLISAACVIPAVLFVLQGVISANLAGHQRDWRDIVFNLLDWLALAALTFIPTHLGTRFSLRRLGWWRLAAVHTLGVIGFCFLWASMGMMLGISVHHYPAVPPFAWSYLNWLLITIPFGVLIYSAMLGGLYAYEYFFEAREREGEAFRLSAQLSEARLDALRIQLNPHFIFNSLNTVLVLVRDKQTAAASRMLELLAEVLRQVLDSTRPREVPLADEFRFAERYLAIEQVRFSDRLRVEWATEELARSALVPDLIIQPLIENAVQHGIARRAEGGTLTIAARVVGDSLEVFVRDDGAGIEQPETEGVGLSNTRERLRTLYGDAASVTITRPLTGGTQVLLRLPYRISTP